MTAPNNSKDTILVNCHGIPETICVETKFISQSGAQKQNHPLFYSTTKGNFELNRDQITPAINMKPVSNRRAFVSIPTKPTVPAAQQSQLCQPPQATSSYMQSATAFANFNSTSMSTGNFFNNSLIGQNVIRPAVPTLLSNAPHIQNYNLNNSVLPGSLETLTPMSFSNKSSSYSDKLQQTDISAFKGKSIGIQCKLDDELWEFDEESPEMRVDSSENNENVESEKKDFLMFIKENSTQHKNCTECLVCGELSKSNKYFYRHMAAHRGQKVLCFKCGQCLEHKNLLHQHKCQKSLRQSKAILKCPHYSCNVNAISLMELYDHLNEHANIRMYKCSACRKGFCTGQEFWRHLLIRAKCYTSAKRKLFQVYGLESQRDRTCRVRVFTLHTFRKCTVLAKAFLSQRAAKQGLCKICLKTSNNKFIYSRHRRFCISKFKKRLIRKRFVQ